MKVFSQYVVKPLNYNILHYLAYQNKNKSADRAIKFETPYISDQFGNTPLKIAIHRNSTKIVALIVENAIESEEMLRRISNKELCQIIEFSPTNLKDLFDSALVVVDHKSVPKFGKID